MELWRIWCVPSFNSKFSKKNKNKDISQCGNEPCCSSEGLRLFISFWAEVNNVAGNRKWGAVLRQALNRLLCLVDNAENKLTQKHISFWFVLQREFLSNLTVNHQNSNGTIFVLISEINTFLLSNRRMSTEEHWKYLLYFGLKELTSKESIKI